jgi:hypothetical protein
MHAKRNFILALMASTIAAGALAQKPGVSDKTSIDSQPGKAVITRDVNATAQVLSIDKQTRQVSLKGPKGDVIELVAGDDVKNLDQVNAGDLVVVRYQEALTLELKKVGADSSGGVSVREQTRTANKGDRPGASGSREVNVVATVTAVDPVKSTITLKGPKNEMTLPVQNPDQFKVVKVGDKVDVTYREALALSVEPAKKK